MTTREFQWAGSISEGTLLCHETMCPMLDALKALDYARYCDFVCDHAADMEAHRDRFVTDTYGETWEALFGELNHVAAENDHYFGAHPDDGAALGFWPIEWLD